MKSWRRGTLWALGISVTWGAVGIVAGALLARLPGFDSDLPFALLFAPLAFSAGLVFSAILLVVEGNRTFDRMPVSRVAMLGAVSGLLLSAIIVLGAAYRGEAVRREFMLFGPPLVAGSALCATASLFLARRAARDPAAESHGA